MSDKKNKPNPIGYGEPPKHSQFKPGVSGNPNGRPIGSKNKKIVVDGVTRFAEIVLEQAEKLIPVNEGGKKSKIPTLDAVFKSIAINALKGKIGAQKLFVELTQEAAADKERKWNARLQAAIDFKEWAGPIYEERDEFEAEGYDVGPPPTNLRADEVLIDTASGDVEYIFRLTKEEEKYFDEIEVRKRDLSSWATRIISSLKKTTNPEEERELNATLDAVRFDYEQLCKIIRDPTPEELEKLRRNWE